MKAHITRPEAGRPGPEEQRLAKHALKIFLAAVRAVEPARLVETSLREQGFPRRAFQRVFVLGAGKGARPMDRALEDRLGPAITSGLAVVPRGYGADPSRRITIREGGHPVPDRAGAAAARSIIDLAAQAGEDDLVIGLWSGGASALLPAPWPGLTLSDKARVTSLLLRCGAPIAEINAVRKHLSCIKGGRLAREIYPATGLSLVLSDVVGDRLDAIASGPTEPDKTTFEDCSRILKRRGLWQKTPAAVRRHVLKGLRGDLPETPKPGDRIFERIETRLVGGNRIALEGAREEARRLGYHTLILSSLMQGEARELAVMHAAIAREARETGNPVTAPACLLSGGEAAVNVTGRGRGGRNQEFALAALMALRGAPRIAVLSGGTDGIDGNTDAAGGAGTGRTLLRAEALGLNPEGFLRRNDSNSFFRRTGGLVLTGPTHTNVMDLRIILVR